MDSILLHNLVIKSDTFPFSGSKYKLKEWTSYPRRRSVASAKFKKHLITGYCNLRMLRSACLHRNSRKYAIFIG